MVEDVPTVSLLPVTVESMRPDIEDVRNAPEKIKAKLTYCNADELDQGLQKVQPLPYLDKEIKKFKDVVNTSVEPAKRVGDYLPSNVMDKIEEIIKISQDRKIGIFKAIQLLDYINDAYKYACMATLDKFDIRRSCLARLKSYDDLTKKLVRSRMDTEMDKAEDCVHECFRLLEQCVEEAKSDRKQQSERKEKEADFASEEDFSYMHSETKITLQSEVENLTSISEQCTEDLDIIDTERKELESKMAHACQEHKKEEAKRQQQLQVNRERQRQLESELATLRRQERAMEKDSKQGQELQEKADELLLEVDGEMTKWKNEIETLREKIQDSLQVMNIVSDCTNWIMLSAKKQKTQWRQRLEDLEVEVLLNLRDTLIAHGGMHLMLEQENSANLKEIEKRLKELNDEKRDKARRGFKLMVQKCDESITQFNEEKLKCDEKIKKHGEMVGSLNDEVKKVDETIRILRPSVALDTMEDRYERRKTVIDRAYEEDNSFKGLDVTSIGNYKEQL